MRYRNMGGYAAKSRGLTADHASETSLVLKALPTLSSRVHLVEITIV
jgi:hypothetical protein